MLLIGLGVYYWKQNRIKFGRKPSNVYVENSTEPVPKKKLLITGTKLISSTNPHVLTNSRELILCVDNDQ